MKTKKLQGRGHKLLTIFIIFGILWSVNMRAAFGEEEQSAAEEVDLGQAFINAYESKDEAKMKSLVKENKSAVSKEMVNMIDYATSGEVKDEEMAWLINVSNKMASVYSAEFSDKKLENFVANYKKWTKKELEERKKADGIFYLYKKDLKNKDYDGVVDKWDTSLEIYRGIGDRLAEAKRLNEIALTFGKLGSFKTSIKFFNDARLINNEIGNSWGEANDLRYIAASYVALEDYTSAIENYKSALNIVHNLKDNAQRAIILNDIAIAESKMKNIADVK